MLDISNICRICLKEEDPKLPIFTENDEKSESKPTLPEKIMSFARVKVVKDDGLPMYICVKCYCQVDTTVEFKRLCEESFHFFTQQLDAFSNSRAISPYNQDAKETSDGYDNGIKCVNNVTQVQELSKEIPPFNQHWIIPEESIKTEEFEREYTPEEDSTTQVFRITGNDESWVDICETEIEPAVIKCEPTWEYSDFEFDLTSLKIENDGDGYLDEERVNPLEINSEDVPNVDRSGTPFSNDLTTSSSTGKTWKCRSCRMEFSNRRELGFHISVAHRRCGTCGQYFFSNKDKGGHKCSGNPAEEKTYIQAQANKSGQCCHLCNKTVKQMRSHMAWHRKRKLKDSVISKSKNVETLLTNTGEQESDESEYMIKCRLCDVICSGVKGFKIHLTLMHSDHRIVYACFVCKSRKFYSRAGCSKHVIKKHGLVTNGSIQLELKRVSDSRKDVKTLLRKDTNRRETFSTLKPNKVDRGNVDELEENETHTPQNRTRARRVKFTPRRSKRTPHPPFSTQIPIIMNNFDVRHDTNGIKLYVCRGCNFIYKRYISAYNHYYTTTKRAAKYEQNPVIDGKPYNCKFCSLKFASRSQAMMHRIHAHKYFHKKVGLEKK